MASLAGRRTVLEDTHSSHGFDRANMDEIQTCLDWQELVAGFDALVDVGVIRYDPDQQIKYWDDNGYRV